jgi:hypothetical protein
VAEFWAEPADKFYELKTKDACPSANRFGDIVVIIFFVVQALDGALTYLGLHTWGPSIEANPLVSSAVTFAGAGTGLAAAKLFAAGLGMVLHLRRVHLIIAFLSAFYIVVAIVPWTMLFLGI